mmetsp:Transcript_26398/g.44090  ORF Transcript_26398/g.44090 Transcript_26398/m.44090 type:complete len:232 (-) Transcript_26398:20-715(-)
MADDEYTLSSLQLGDNNFIPEYRGPLCHTLQGFAEWDILFFDAKLLIARVLVRPVWALPAHWWRWLVPGTTPPLDLVFTKLFYTLLLVCANKSSVTSLIQSPVLVDIKPVCLKFFQSIIHCVGASLKQTCVHGVKLGTCLSKHSTSTLSFSDAILGQRSIRHTNEDILFVPSTLSVSEEGNLDWILNRNGAQSCDSRSAKHPGGANKGSDYRHLIVVGTLILTNTLCSSAR